VDCGKSRRKDTLNVKKGIVLEENKRKYDSPEGGGRGGRNRCRLEKRKVVSQKMGEGTGGTSR